MCDKKIVSEDVTGNIIKKTVDLKKSEQDEKEFDKDHVGEEEVSSVIKEITDPEDMNEMEVQSSFKKLGEFTWDERERLQDWAKDNLSVERMRATARFKEAHNLGQYGPPQPMKFDEFDLDRVFFDIMKDFVGNPQSDAEDKEGKGPNLEGEIYKVLAPYLQVANSIGFEDDFLNTLQNFGDDFTRFYDAINQLRFEQKVELMQDYLKTFESLILNKVKSLSEEYRESPEKLSRNVVNQIRQKDNQLIKPKKGAMALPVDMFYDLRKLQGWLSKPLPQDRDKAKAKLVKLLNTSSNTYKALKGKKSNLLTDLSIRDEAKLPEDLSYQDIFEDISEAEFNAEKEKVKAQILNYLNFQYLDRKEALKEVYPKVGGLAKRYRAVHKGKLDKLQADYKEEFGLEKELRAINKAYDQAIGGMNRILREYFQDDISLAPEFFQNFHNFWARQKKLFNKSIYSSSGVKDGTTPYQALVKLINNHVLEVLSHKAEFAGEFNNAAKKAPAEMKKFLLDFKREFTSIIQNYQKIANAVRERLNNKAEKHKELTDSFRINNVLREHSIDAEGVSPYSDFMDSDPHFAAETPERLFHTLSKRYQWEDFLKRSINSAFIRLREEYRKPAKDESGRIIWDTESSVFSEAESDLISYALYGVNFNPRSDAAVWYGMKDSWAEMEEEDAPKGSAVDFNTLFRNLSGALKTSDEYIRAGTRNDWARKNSIIQNFFNNVLDSEGNLNRDKSNLNLGPYFVESMKRKNMEYLRQFRDRYHKVRKEKEAGGRELLTTSLEKKLQSIDKAPLEKNYAYEDKVGITDDKVKTIRDFENSLREAVDGVKQGINYSVVQNLRKLVDALEKEKSDYQIQKQVLEGELDSLRSLGVTSSYEDLTPEQRNQRIADIQELIKMIDTRMGEIDEDLEITQLGKGEEALSRFSIYHALLDSVIIGLLEPVEFIVEKDDDGNPTDMYLERAVEQDAPGRDNYEFTEDIERVAPSEAKLYYVPLTDLEELNLKIRQFKSRGITKSNMAEITERLQGFKNWIARRLKRPVLDFIPKSGSSKKEIDFSKPGALATNFAPAIIRGEEFIKGQTGEIQNAQQISEKIKELLSAPEADYDFSNIMDDIRRQFNEFRFSTREANLMQKVRGRLRPLMVHISGKVEEAVDLDEIQKILTPAPEDLDFYRDNRSADRTDMEEKLPLDVQTYLEDNALKTELSAVEFGEVKEGLEIEDQKKEQSRRDREESKRLVKLIHLQSPEDKQRILNYFNELEASQAYNQEVLETAKTIVKKQTNMRDLDSFEKYAVNALELAELLENQKDSLPEIEVGKDKDKEPIMKKVLPLYELNSRGKPRTQNKEPIHSEFMEDFLKDFSPQSLSKDLVTQFRNERRPLQQRILALRARADARKDRIDRLEFANTKVTRNLKAAYRRLGSRKKILNPRLHDPKFVTREKKALLYSQYVEASRALERVMSDLRSVSAKGGALTRKENMLRARLTKNSEAIAKLEEKAQKMSGERGVGEIRSQIKKLNGQQRNIRILLKEITRDRKTISPDMKTLRESKLELEARLQDIMDALNYEPNYADSDDKKAKLERLIRSDAMKIRDYSSKMVKVRQQLKIDKEVFAEETQEIESLKEKIKDSRTVQKAEERTNILSQENMWKVLSNPIYQLKGKYFDVEGFLMDIPYLKNTLNFITGAQEDYFDIMQRLKAIGSYKDQIIQNLVSDDSVFRPSVDETNPEEPLGPVMERQTQRLVQDQPGESKKSSRLLPFDFYS